MSENIEDKESAGAITATAKSSLTSSSSANINPIADEAHAPKKISVFSSKNSIGPTMSEVDVNNNGDKDKEITNLRSQNKDLNEKFQQVNFNHKIYFLSYTTR